MSAFDAFESHLPAYLPAPADPHHAALRAEAALPRCALIDFTPADRPRLLVHLQQLDQDDRMLRFSHAMRDDALARYVSGLDFARDRICGLVDEHAHILALAHVAIRSGDADFGLSVSPHWRRHGLGKILFNHVVELAQQAGAGRVLCHSISPAVLHMACTRGFRRVRGNPAAPLVLQLDAAAR